MLYHDLLHERDQLKADKAAMLQQLIDGGVTGACGPCETCDTLRAEVERLNAELNILRNYSRAAKEMDALRTRLASLVKIAEELAEHRSMYCASRGVHNPPDLAAYAKWKEENKL